MGEDRSTQRETSPTANLSITKPTLSGLESNPVLRGEQSATNKSCTHGVRTYDLWAYHLRQVRVLVGILQHPLNVAHF